MFLMVFYMSWQQESVHKETSPVFGIHRWQSLCSSMLLLSNDGTHKTCFIVMGSDVN
jgi:hypothetical protein